MVDFARNSPDVAALVWPNRSSWAAWRELRNKLEAFRAFATADRWMNDPTDAGGELVVRTKAVAAQSDFLGLWTTEGLGYYFAARALKGNESVGGLLSCQPHGLPERSMIPLHTGMGLALASDALRCLPRSTGGSGARGFVVQYLQRCRENSLDGYVGATLEALGLIARLLRPTMLTELDRQLREINAAWVATFWHGVGRGLYFTPVNVLPCTSAAWPSLKKALSEPPHDVGRENALAGLSWAVALVNVRHPEVLELFLNRHRRSLPVSVSVANGIASAAAVWHAWAPHSNYLRQLCSHQPRGRDDATMTSWERNARTQCRPEFFTTVNQLWQQQRMDELFRVPVSANDKV
ncbi:MAG TPA: hypothetical protein VMM76_23950 [Pirellulaceae bacterium]|nr:hypothetical protein [Pirellulaceae bacterium]